jgi:hypothetical protein
MLSASCARPANSFESMPSRCSAPLTKRKATNPHIVAVVSMAPKQSRDRQGAVFRPAQSRDRQSS